MCEWITSLPPPQRVCVQYSGEAVVAALALAWTHTDPPSHALVVVFSAAIVLVVVSGETTQPPSLPLAYRLSSLLLSTTPLCTFFPLSQSPPQPAPCLQFPAVCQLVEYTEVFALHTWRRRWILAGCAEADEKVVTCTHDKGAGSWCWCCCWCSVLVYWLNSNLLTDCAFVYHACVFCSRSMSWQSSSSQGLMHRIHTTPCFPATMVGLCSLLHFLCHNRQLQRVRASLTL